MRISFIHGMVEENKCSTRTWNFHVNTVKISDHNRPSRRDHKYWWKQGDFDNMDELSAADKRLKSARASLFRDVDNVIAALDQQDRLLNERMLELDHKKHDINQVHGNLDATDDDRIEINAGGKVIVAKRSMLTQIQGSRMEALFSGRWEKKLMRDGHGRIFLDVDPTCFQAIVDYLNEMTICVSIGTLWEIKVFGFRGEYGRKAET